MRGASLSWIPWLFGAFGALLTSSPAEAGFCTACARPRFLASGDRHPLSVALPLVYSELHAGSSDEATVSVLELDSAWSLTLDPRISLDVVLPLRFRSVDGQPLGLDGTPRAGIGDTQVTGRFRALALPANDPFDLDLRIGVALPFGGTSARPSPGLLALPFGQQVVQVVLGAQASLQLDGARILGFGWAKLPLHESGPGFQAGRRGTLGLAYLFDWEQFGLEVGGGLYLEEADRWRNGPMVPTTGHLDAFTRLGLRLFTATEWPIELAVVLPVVLRTEGEVALHSAGTYSVSLGHDFEL